MPGTSALGRRGPPNRGGGVGRGSPCSTRRVVCGAIRFDFDTEDFFAGLPIAGDAINAPAAKQLTKIKPLLFILFLLLISLSDSWLHGFADAPAGRVNALGWKESETTASPELLLVILQLLSLLCCAT